MGNALLIAACLFCSHREPQPAYTPTPPPPIPAPVANGAIFQPANGYAPLTSGQRAAQTGQSNSLVGEISVVISEVLPNGTMRIRGEKSLRINRGNETIRISGIVRPGDISADNRVASTRVADARIDYVGRGEIQRASRQGWLQRFFSIISPL
jgi:flagellar L-ring protein precursor FlgH